MNVLIINPPAQDHIKIVREGRCMQRQEAWGTSWAPLTLALIAAVLRDAGFSIQLKDCSNDDISFEELEGLIRQFKPSLIICNTSTPSISSDVQVAGLAKNIDKEIKTAFFGIHVSALPEETFALNPDVEYLISGEPEDTLRALAQSLKEKTPLSRVAGLIYKENGHIVRNESRGFIGNLDELPYPAWDLVNIKGYRLPISNRPFLLVLTGRGCPYPCKFCSAGVFYGKKPRLRSWPRIVSEMKYVKERFGVNDFLFWSENATVDRQQLGDISRGLTAELPGVKWVCNGRVDMVDEDLLSTMKKAGCWMIGYGVEAGTQRVLDLMHKNIKLEDIEKAVKLTQKVGLEVTGHVILGYPGETKEDILKTIKFVKKLDFDYIQPYCCVPFPGSRLYEEATKCGYIISGDWAKFEQNFSILTTPQLAAQDVMRLRRKLVRSFYLDPRKIMKTLFKVRSTRELSTFLKFAKAYFSSWAKG